MAKAIYKILGCVIVIEGKEAEKETWRRSNEEEKV